MKDLSLDEVRKILNAPTLQLSFLNNAGGDHPAQRLTLRRELVRMVSADSELEAELLKIEKLPELPNGFASLSHCDEEGVVAYCETPVGVDLEEVARVQAKLALRVSKPEEIIGATNPASLWVAKESAYKALKAFAQPPLLSQVEIGGWKKLTSQFETFELRNAASFSNHVGHGLVYQNSIHAFGIFIFSRSV